MKWLDLFCGAGCVADGIIAAGDEVIGVDIKPNKEWYPGRFICMDALELFQSVGSHPYDLISMRDGGVWAFGERIDGIWASPPCLRDTPMRHAKGAKGAAHPDLITPTRKFLQATGLPYVIENVPKAPLIDPVGLIGYFFNLGVTVNGVRYHLERPRIFETNWDLKPPYVGYIKQRPVVCVIGSHARNRSKKYGGRGTADFVGFEGGHRAIMGRAFGIPDERRITCKGISDGIPPAYSRYIVENFHQWTCLL